MMNLRRTVNDARPLRVVLIGPMGAGKSTLAQRLAVSLGYDFVDIDSEVEHSAGMRIQEIFAHQGEAAFRCAEEQVLSEVLQRQKIVVATGGGCVLSLENRNRIGQDSWVVYLSVSPENAIARCEAAGESRPLLNGYESLSAWKSAFSVREPHYETLADIHIATDNKPLDSLLSDLLAHWEVVCE